ncbi:MAG: hypothetical protein J6N52_07310 [Clostridia bacterium]|nr:hypothetical protein [Clostridia bacterium]
MKKQLCLILTVSAALNLYYPVVFGADSMHVDQIYATSSTDRYQNRIGYLPEDGEWRITATGTGLDEAALVVGIYDREKKLKEAVFSPSASAVEMTADIDVKGIENGDFAKIMTWEQNSLRPIRDYVILQQKSQNKQKLLSGNRLDTPLFPLGTPSVYTGGNSVLQQNGVSFQEEDFAIPAALSDGKEDNLIQFIGNQCNVIYDLQNAYEVSEVRLWIDAKSVKKIKVFTGFDNLHYTQAVQLQEGFEPVMNIPLSPGVTGRYVKVLMEKADGAQNLCVNEIALYGCEKESEELLYSEKAQNTAIDRYESKVIDLQECYSISSIDVDAVMNPSSGLEAQYSVDGKKYFSGGYYLPEPDGRIVIPGLSGQNARYVKLTLHQEQAEKSALYTGMEIHGWKAEQGTAYGEKIAVRPTVKNFSTVYLDWSGYSNDKVKTYNIYIEEKPFQSVEGLAAKVSGKTLRFHTYAGLKPEQKYYAAVTPVLKDGTEDKAVTPVTFYTPAVLDADRFGDIMHINDSPYGGGNYVSHNTAEDNTLEEKNLMKKLELLGQLDGVNRNRWYNHDINTYKKYASVGINFQMFYHGTEYLEKDHMYGIWSFSTANEPDLKGTSPEAYAKAVKKNGAELKAQDSRNVLLEPALGGTEQRSLDFLERFYQSESDVKDYFDAVDIHPYCKYENGTLEGLSAGAPEMLLGKTDDVRSVMRKYGDEEKPIVFTELGWSTYTGGSHLKAVDRETQRNYLARAYMHAYAKGVKGLHWYSFQDDGLNTANMEHNFGLIDWNGNPKESYYGYYILSRVLNNAQFIGAADNITHPNYGYRYWSEENNQYITALWAADEKQRTVKISVQPNETNLKVIGIDGRVFYAAAENCSATVKINGAPIFVYSNEWTNYEVE